MMIKEPEHLFVSNMNKLKFDKLNDKNTNQFTMIVPIPVEASTCTKRTSYKRTAAFSVKAFRPIAPSPATSKMPTDSTVDVTDYVIQDGNHNNNNNKNHDTNMHVCGYATAPIPHSKLGCYFLPSFNDLRLPLDPTIPINIKLKKNKSVSISRWVNNNYPTKLPRDKDVPVYLSVPSRGYTSTDKYIGFWRFTYPNECCNKVDDFYQHFVSNMWLNYIRFNFIMEVRVQREQEDPNHYDFLVYVCNPHIEIDVMYECEQMIRNNGFGGKMTYCIAPCRKITDKPRKELSPTIVAAFSRIVDETREFLDASGQVYHTTPWKRTRMCSSCNRYWKYKSKWSRPLNPLDTPKPPLLNLPTKSRPWPSS